MLFSHNEYIVTSSSSELPVSLDTVKQHLYIDLSDTSQDVYLTLLINAVSEFAEKYTKLTFITKTFNTFRDGFGYQCYEIRKAPVIVINSITYLVNGVDIVLDSDQYILTVGVGYPYIYPAENVNWPTNDDNIVQSVKISFDAGYGSDESFIPASLKMAILNHIARMYSDRGDCNQCGCEACLPQETKLIYEMFRIKSINALPVCRNSC